MKTENVKCGEIFRCDSGKFLFGCFYCSATFDWYLDVLQHIEDHFLYGILPSEDTKNEPEPIDIESAASGIDVDEDDFKSFEFVESLKPRTIVPENVELKINFEVNPTTHDTPSKKPKISVSDLSINLQNVKTTGTAQNPDKAKRTKVWLRYPWGPSFLNKRVQCDICNKEMASSSLRYHMATHANRREFTCSICSKTFNIKNTLESHLKSHSEEFSCEFCGRTFRHKLTLNLHIRSHTGEKPYECSVCNTKFSRRKTLTNHIRIHSDERAFKCEFCPKTFRIRNTLQVHRKIHLNQKDHECNVCFKRFIKAYKLKEHYRIHTGERPFLCTFCDKTFSCPNAHKQHLNLHTGATPFKCRFCDSGFQTRGRRSTHEKKHKNNLLFAAVNSIKIDDN